jgi:hypothetical protein
MFVCLLFRISQTNNYILYIISLYINQLLILLLRFNINLCTKRFFSSMNKIYQQQQQLQQQRNYFGYKPYLAFVVISADCCRRRGMQDNNNG